MANAGGRGKSARQMYEENKSRKVDPVMARQYQHLNVDTDPYIETPGGGRVRSSQYYAMQDAKARQDLQNQAAALAVSQRASERDLTGDYRTDEQKRRARQNQTMTRQTAGNMLGMKPKGGK